MHATARIEPWLTALRASSKRLATTVDGLPGEVLSAPSFVIGWSIARVLSHLGSAAEIGAMLLRRGIDGNPAGPSSQDTEAVRRRWDRLPGVAQRDAWCEADRRHRALLDSLNAEQRESVRVPYFAGLARIGVYLGYRLSEQSVHAWDVQVALDPSATIPAPEVELLWERLDRVATRFRDAETLARLGPRQLSVRLTDVGRTVCLDLSTELHLYPCEPLAPTGTVSGSAEAILRLVYGRHRPEDRVTTTGTTTLGDLRSLFPGV